MNLGRIGHYNVPTDALGHSSCQTAIVVSVISPEHVNLDVWDHQGRSEPRVSVHVSASLSGEYGAEIGPGESFHLAMDCPERR